MKVHLIFVYDNSPSYETKQVPYEALVRNAAREARTKVGFSPNDYDITVALVSDVKAMYPTVTTVPTIIARYDTGTGEKPAYIRGYGSQAALVKVLSEVFTNSVKEIGDKPTGEGVEESKDIDTGGKGGFGFGNGKGFGFGKPRKCGMIDTFLADLGIKKTIVQALYGTGAAVLGFAAFNTSNKTAKIMQGAGAAVLGYMALKVPEGDCKSPQKKGVIEQ